jgi:hypothetical protein
MLEIANQLIDVLGTVLALITVVILLVFRKKFLSAEGKTALALNWSSFRAGIGLLVVAFFFFFLAELGEFLRNAGQKGTLAENLGPLQLCFLLFFLLSVLSFLYLQIRMIQATYHD